jgi:hypothetical protein
MQTKTDHVEAQAFLSGRMTAALVTGDAKYLEVPERRAWTGVVTGVLLTLFIAGGFAIFGLVTHSSKPPAPVPAVSSNAPAGRTTTGARPTP